MPFIYYGHYYGGDADTMPVFTFISPGNFSEYEADFTEFLNGLQVKTGKL